MKSRCTVLFIIALGLAGCRASGRGRSPTGHLDVRWTGTEQGRLSGPATAEWCSAFRLLQIHGFGGDTGVAVAIYPGDSVKAGTYRIVNSAKAESLPPSARLALRWAAQTSVKGFQGESGSVVLERSPNAGLSGRMSAAARSATDNGMIRVTGNFRGLTPIVSTRGCSRAIEDVAEDPQSRDTLVH